MAKVNYTGPVENLQGSMSKKGAIFRRKRYKIDDKGHYVEGKAEVYQRLRERDYAKNPVTEAERAHQTRFGEACKQTTLELQNPERKAYWQNRFEKQIKKPEAGNTKCYMQLQGFIKAMLLKESQIHDNA